MKATRIANGAFVAVAAVCLLGAVAAGSITNAVGWLLAAAVALLALLLPAAARANFLIVLISVAVPLYGAEFVLMPKKNTVRQRAEAAGRPYDARGKAQVVADLRHAGKRAFPAMHRGAGQLRLADGEAVALGGISNVTSVMCNETGTYAIFESDQHGFNNPPGLWRPDSVRIAVVGDSYTVGWCVHPDSNLVGRIRAREPRTLNLGIGGNGPLTELATVREYLPRVRPDVVVWAFYENDLADLEEEKEDPRLLEYLEPEHRRDLADRQSEIDRQLSEIVEGRATPREMPPPSWAEHRVIRKLRQVASLHHLRQALHAVGLGLGRGGGGEVAAGGRPCCDIRLFAQILALAKRDVESWGGTLVFVFVPTRARYDRSPPVHESGAEMRARDEVLGAAKALSIPVIDLDATFSALPQPERLYVYPGAHLDDTGYRIAAEAIIQGLERLRLMSEEAQAPHTARGEPLAADTNASGMVSP